VSKITKIEVLDTGIVQVQVLKTVVVGETEFEVGGRSPYHRFTINPGETPALKISQINDYLSATMSVSEIDANSASRLADIVSAAHTEEAISAYQALLAANSED
jgi:hypothetical protein